MRPIKDPTDPPRAATRQDSLNAYNAAVELMNALNSAGYGDPRNIDNLFTGEKYDVEPLKPYTDRDVQNALNERYDNVRSYLEEGPDPHRQKMFETYQRMGAGAVEGKTYEEWEGFQDSYMDGPVLRTRELSVSKINPDLPLGYYDPRIDPQGMLTQAHPETGDFVQFPYYDPLAIKPYDTLTAEEKAERLEKYGPEPERPKSDLVEVRRPDPAPRPLPSRMPSSEVDKRLRPMTVLKEEKGREPELIMRANPRMRTGEEPNYYKVWDDKRKQWTTRPVEPEELERYRRQNRIEGS